MDTTARVPGPIVPTVGARKGAVTRAIWIALILAILGGVAGGPAVASATTAPSPNAVTVAFAPTSVTDLAGPVAGIPGSAVEMGGMPDLTSWVEYVPWGVRIRITAADQRLLLRGVAGAAGAAAIVCGPGAPVCVIAMGFAIGIVLGLIDRVNPRCDIIVDFNRYDWNNGKWPVRVWRTC